MLIRDMGNCGNTDKLLRIMKALDIAKKNDAKVVIVLDEVVYGKNSTIFTAEQVKSYKFNRSTLYIDNQEFGWWDITKVNLLF